LEGKAKNRYLGTCTTQLAGRRFAQGGIPASVDMAGRSDASLAEKKKKTKKNRIARGIPNS